jgi:hypothetical protein
MKTIILILLYSIGVSYSQDNNGLGQNLSITLSNEYYESYTYIYFREECTFNFDPQFDVNRLFGLNHIPLVYTMSYNSGFELYINESLAYNCVPSLCYYDSIGVILAVYDGNPGTFTLTFEELNSLETETQNVTVILEDLKLDEMIQISEGTTYDFVTEADDDAERFVVHFYTYKQEPLSITNDYHNKEKQTTYYNLLGQLICYTLDCLKPNTIYIEVSNEGVRKIIKL